MFEVPASEREFRGDPNDRKALVKHRQRVKVPPLPSLPLPSCFASTGGTLTPARPSSSTASAWRWPPPLPPAVLLSLWSSVQAPRSRRCGPARLLCSPASWPPLLHMHHCCFVVGLFACQVWCTCEPLRAAPVPSFEPKCLVYCTVDLKANSGLVACCAQLHCMCMVLPCGHPGGSVCAAGAGGGGGQREAGVAEEAALGAGQVARHAVQGGPGAQPPAAGRAAGAHLWNHPHRV